MANDIDSYFMLPAKNNTIGNIYPIKLKDYEHFKSIGSKYLMCGQKWLSNMLKLPKDICPLDYFVDIGYSTSTLEKELNKIDEKNMDDELKEIKNNVQLLKNNGLDFNIDNIVEMFEMTLHQKVVFNPIGKIGDIFEYTFDIIGTEYFINRDNFDIYRTIVMEQNLIYEPLTSPQKIGNEAIANAINSLNKNGIETSIASVLSSVKMFSGMSDDELKEYTYYRLMMDFESVNRINNNLINAIFRSVGNDQCNISALAEKIDMDKNPYKGILQKHSGYNSLDSRLKKG